MSRNNEQPVGRRLRRVRMQLMAIFLVAFLAGIGALSVLAISLDARARQDAVDAALRASVSEGADLVSIDHGATQVSRLDAFCQTIPLTDLFAVDRRSPTDAPGPPTNSDFSIIFPGFEKELQDDRVIALARGSVADEDEATRTIDGRRYLALPYKADPERGAIVGSASNGAAVDGHRRFVRRISLADVVLILCALIGAELFGRRAMRASTVALEAQERFLANAAHDLRNPIAAIRAAAESARMRDVDAATAVEEMEKSAVVASDVIESMLTLAHLDAGASPVLEPVRLDLLVEQILDGYVNAPRVTVDLDSVVVNGNPALLTRAITNLLNNAVEHSDDGASITVAVHDNWVAVQDQGPGIDPAVLPTLFDRFSASGSTRGYGLGLSIVQAAAQAHGGSVVATNLPDRGCEFRITLARP